MRNHAETNGKQEVSFIFSNFLCLDLKRALSFGAGVGAEEKETLGSAKDQNGMCQTSGRLVFLLPAVVISHLCICIITY